jgi:hypothetical protein
MEAVLETPTEILDRTPTASEVDAMITMRLLAFHDALVQRGQLPPAPPAEAATPQM